MWYRFIMLYKVVLYRSVDETLVSDHLNESQYFHVVLFIILYKWLKLELKGLKIA